jgi:receptor protein-tyrosine kinase
MSLIERAVGKSAKPVSPPSPEQGGGAESAVDERENRIERAIARAVADEADGGQRAGEFEHVVAPDAERAAQADRGQPGGGRLRPAAENLRETAIEPTPAAGSLVELDLQRLSTQGMIVPDADKTALAEEFRVIKRPLIANAMGRGASQVRNRNLIMVTSAVPGEGKTFCAINLAMSMAVERDYTVLLVDADVARPSLHTTLGIPRMAGLMEVLVGDKRLNEVLVSTNVEKLRILPAGKPHRHATELLASESMAELLDDLATRYSDRIVVFDSPPLLATSEAKALATQMGQVVLVVEAGQTTQQAVQEALQEVESCEIVGLIYNKAKASSDHYGYYSYGYGKYGQ